MPKFTTGKKELVLQYGGNRTWRFSRIATAATDTQLFHLAEALNSLQAEPVQKVFTVVTKILA